MASLRTALAHLRESFEALRQAVERRRLSYAGETREFAAGKARATPCANRGHPILLARPILEVRAQRFARYATVMCPAPHAKGGDCIPQSKDGKKSSAAEPTSRFSVLLGAEVTEPPIMMKKSRCGVTRWVPAASQYRKMVVNVCEDWDDRRARRQARSTRSTTKNESGQILI